MLNQIKSFCASKSVFHKIFEVADSMMGWFSITSMSWTKNFKLKDRFFAERKSVCWTGRNAEPSQVVVCKNKSVFQNEMFKVDDSKENKEQNDGGVKREGKGRVIKRKLEKERKNA